MATMTVSDFINEITLESAVVSNEFACEAAIFDLMVDDDDDYGYASESYDLAIDDDDLAYSYGGYGYASEEAKSFGQRFKDMLSNIGEWFKKIGRGIKQWITGIIDKIKNRAKGNMVKGTATALGTAAGDLVTAGANDQAKYDAIENRIKEYRIRLNDETDPAKRTKLEAEIRRLENESKHAFDNTGKAAFNAAIKAGEQLSKYLTAYLRDITSSYNLAKRNTQFIEKLLMEIIKTPVKGMKKNLDDGARLADYARGPHSRSYTTYDNDPNPDNPKKYYSNLAVSDATAKSALKTLQDNKDPNGDSVFDKMLKQLDKVGPEIDKAIEHCASQQAVIDGVATIFNKAMNQIASPVNSARVRNQVKAPFPEKELIDGAQDIIDSCDEFAKMADNLRGALGPDTGNADKKTKAISKALTAYSNTAHKISTLAGYIVKCGNASVQFMAS